MSNYSLYAELLEVVWHETLPVFTIDCDKIGRIATGGGDNVVNLWKLSEVNQTMPVVSISKSQRKKRYAVQHMASLKRHFNSVNCVKFSPSGQYLATASDDGWILLWAVDAYRTEMLQLEKQKEEQIRLESRAGECTTEEGPSNPLSFAFDESEYSCEVWTTVLMLEAHKRDIYDLAWSPDSKFILSGSTDGTAIVSSVGVKMNDLLLQGHSSFVQGVCWDPLGHFIATQSKDRSVRLYAQKKQKKATQLPASGVGPSVTIEAAEPDSSSQVQIGIENAADEKSAEQTQTQTQTQNSQNPVRSGNTSSRAVNRPSFSISNVLTHRKAPSSSAPPIVATEGLPGDTSSVTNDGIMTSDSDQSSHTGSEAESQRHRLFLDEMGCQSFFRRPSWSPDGGMLVCPSGQIVNLSQTHLGGPIAEQERGEMPARIETEDNREERSVEANVIGSGSGNGSSSSSSSSSEQPNPLPIAGSVEYATFVFSRGLLSEPAVVLVGGRKPSVVVRFCPIEFDLVTPGPEPWYPSTRRHLMAVAHIDEILIYDTQHLYPIGRVSGFHLAPISDVSWSHDGSKIFVSSLDGYCSVIAIDKV